jgi:hypothetical protein
MSGWHANCYCFCARSHPGEKGICSGVLETVRIFRSSIIDEPTQVAMCNGCAEANDRYRVAHGAPPGRP